jgi:hypothetical protein
LLFGFVIWVYCLMVRDFYFYFTRISLDIMWIPLLALIGRLLLFGRVEGLLSLNLCYISVSPLFCYFLVLYLSIKFLVKLFLILGPFYLLKLFFAYNFDFICLRFKILFVMLFDFIVSYLFFY